MSLLQSFGDSFPAVSSRMFAQRGVSLFTLVNRLEMLSSLNSPQAAGRSPKPFFVCLCHLDLLLLVCCFVVLGWLVLVVLALVSLGWRHNLVTWQLPNVTTSQARVSFILAISGIKTKWRQSRAWRSWSLVGAFLQNTGTSQELGRVNIKVRLLQLLGAAFSESTL